VTTHDQEVQLDDNSDPLLLRLTPQSEFGLLL